MRRINVVYSLITDQSKTKVLMVKNQDNDSWTLPGGAVEENESLEEAAVREVKEETGLEVKIFGVVAVNEAILEKQDQQAIFITFKAEIVGGQKEILRPDEISMIEWIDINESDRLMPYYKEGLSEIVRNQMEITYFNEGRV